MRTSVCFPPVSFIRVNPLQILITKGSKIWMEIRFIPAYNNKENIETAGQTHRRIPAAPEEGAAFAGALKTE